MRWPVTTTTTSLSPVHHHRYPFLLCTFSFSRCSLSVRFRLRLASVPSLITLVGLVTARENCILLSCLATVAAPIQGNWLIHAIKRPGGRRTAKRVRGKGTTARRLLDLGLQKTHHTAVSSLKLPRPRLVVERGESFSRTPASPSWYG